MSEPQKAATSTIYQQWRGCRASCPQSQGGAKLHSALHEHMGLEKHDSMHDSHAQMRQHTGHLSARYLCGKQLSLRVLQLPCQLCKALLLTRRGPLLLQHLEASYGVITRLHDTRPIMSEFQTCSSMPAVLCACMMWREH